VKAPSRVKVLSLRLFRIEAFGFKGYQHR